MFKFKAFTLVELLVVIAIVGLLSTIVLAVTSGVSEQGRIAKGLQFSKHLENSLGDYLVGRWTFDETANLCGTNKVCDTSGWNNHGTMNNFVSPYGLVTDTPSGQGQALSFDGTSNYMNCGNSASLNLINSFTITAWVKSTKNNASLFQGIAGKANLSGSEYGYFLTKRPDNKFYFQARTGGPYTREDVSTYSDKTYTDNTWHYLAGVFLSNGSHYLYIDGVQQIAHSGIGTFGPAASSIPFVVGTAYGDVPLNTTYLERFGGLIGDVNLYNTVLSAFQIESHYYAGLNRLLIQGLIDRNEYQKRLAIK
jgi:prepilin-type N-terminal cleavage/methylation domain-containing protein